MTTSSPLGAALNLLSRAPHRVVVSIGLSSVALLSVAAVLAGWELPLSVFYLLPLFIVAAAAGERAAFACAAVAALARTVVAAMIAPLELHPLTPVLTFITCFITYALVGGLVAALASRLREEQIVGRLDPLTGLPNARCFYERVEQERATLLGAPFVVAYLDVDNFKQVNDNRGHSGGDTALAEVGATIAGMLGEHDLAARVGGDEFIILLPATDPISGRGLLGEVHSALVGQIGRRWNIGFSVGAVCYSDWQGSIDALVHAADQAMYEAKRHHKGSVVLVEHPPTVRDRPSHDGQPSLIEVA